MAATVVRTSSATPLPALLNPVHPWRNLWSHRDLIRQFTWRLFLARYRGTMLGLLWSVLFPLAQLAVFVFVFTHVFKMRAWEDRELSGAAEFSVVLFCGMVVYAIFSESVVRSCGLVIENPNFVKKVVFPVEILAVASLGSSLIYAATGLVVVLVGAAMFVETSSWTIVLLPLVIAPLLLWSLGLAWILSSLSVFLRDVGNVVGIVVGQMLFYLTPILYPTANLPEDLRWVAWLNPLTPVIEGARSVVLFGEPPNWRSLGWSGLIGLVLVQVGYAFFMKSKRGFADVL